MKKSKSLLSFGIAILFLATSFVACVNDTGNDVATTDQGTESDITTEVVTKNPYGDNLPEKMDLDGYEYRVLTYEGGNKDDEAWVAFIDIDESSTEVFEDAAYRRNLEVEERLNVHISCVESGGFMVTSDVLHNYVFSGEDICDVAIIQNSGPRTGQLIVNEDIIDLNDLPSVDFSQPYYLQSANETFTISGKHFFFTGDMVRSLYSNSYIWTNMEKWEDFALPDPYQIVLDGAWTLDKCFEFAKGTYQDLDKDGEHSVDDFYGITGIPITLGYCFHSSNAIIFESDEDGFSMPVASERNIDILTRLVEELDNEDCYWESDGYKTSFFNGNSLMFFSGSSIKNLRQATFLAGVLPFPKYDETQDSYRSILAGALLCVPVTNMNLDKTGIITEAMFSASARTVAPAFIESFVEQKVLQDEGSKKMMEIVMNSGAHVLAEYVDPSGLFGGYTLIYDLLANRSAGLASAWDSQKKAVEAGYQDLFDGLE